MSDSQDNYDYKSVLGQVTYHVLDHVVKTLVIGKNQLPFPVTSVKSYIFHSSKSSIPFFDDKRKLENFCEEVVGLLKLESKLRSGEKVRQDRSTVPCFWLSDSYFYSLNKAENTVASAVESVSSVPTAEYIAVLKAICNYFVRSALLKITVTTPYPVRSILSEVSNISFLQQFNAVHCERRALLNDILKRMKADNRLSYDSNKEVFWLAEETNDYGDDEDSPPKVHSSPPAPLTRKTSGGVVLNMGYPAAGVAGSNSKASSDKVKTSAVLKDALRIRSDDFAASAQDETDKGFKFNVTFVGKPSQTASQSASVVPAVKATKSSNTPSTAAVAIATEDVSKSTNSSTKANKEPKESIQIDPLHLQRIVAHCARLMIKRLNVKQPFRIQEMIPMMLHKLFAPSADVPPFKPGPRFDAYFEQLVAAFKRDERFRLDSTYRLNNDPNQLVDVIWISHGKQFLPVPPSKPSVDTAPSTPNPQTNSKLPSAAPSNSFPPMPPTAQIHTAPPEFGGLRIVAPDHEPDEVPASLPDVPRLIPLFLDIVLKKLAVSQPYVIDNIRSHLNDREFLQKHSLRGYQTREQMEAVCRAIIAALKKSPQLAYDEDSYSKAKQTRTTEVFWLTNGSRVPTVGTVDPTRLAANAQALRDNSRASNRNNRNGDKSNNNSKPSASTTPAVLPPAVLEKNERWTSDKRNPKYYLKGEHNPFIDTQKYKSAVERLAKHFVTLALEHFDSFAAADPVYAVANISAALRDGDSLTLAADGSNARQISLSDILVKQEVDAKQLLFDICQAVKNMRKMKFNSVQGKLEMGYFSPQQDSSDHTSTHTSTANKRDRDDSSGGTEMWESARKDVDSMDDWRQSHDAFAEEYAQAKVNNSSSLRIAPPDVVLDHKQLLQQQQQQQQQQQKAAVASNKLVVEPAKPLSAPSKHATPLFKLALSGALGNDATKSSPQRPEPSVSVQPSVAQPPVVSATTGAKPVAGGPPPGFAPPGLGAGPPGIAPSVVPPASTQQKPNPSAAPADHSASRNTPSPMSMLLGLHDPKPKPSAVTDTISTATAGTSTAATAANSSDAPPAPTAAPSNPVPKPFEFTAMSTKFQVDGADLVSAFSVPVVAPKGTTASLATGASSSASDSADDVVSVEAQRKAAMDAHFIRVMEQQKAQRPQSNVYGQSGVLPPHQQQLQQQMTQGPPPTKPQPMSYESFLNAKLRPTLAQQGLGLSVSGGQPRPATDPRLGVNPRLAAEQQRRLLLEQQQQLQQQQQRGMVYSQHQQAQLGLQQHQQQPPAPLPGQRLLTPQQQLLQQRYLQQLAQNPTLQGIKDVLPRVPSVSQPQVQHTPYGGPPNPSVPPRPQPLSQAEYIAMMQEKQRQALLQQQQRASVPVPGGLFGQPAIPPPVKAQRESSSSSEPSDELFFMPKDLLSVLDDDDSASDDDSNDGSSLNAGDVSSSLVQPLNSDLFNFEVANVRPVAVARAVEEPIPVIFAVDQSPAVEEPALVTVEPSIVIPVEEPAQVLVEKSVSLAPVVEEPAEEDLVSVVVEEPASPAVEEPAEEELADEEPASPVVEEPAKEEPASVLVVEEPSLAPVVEEPVSPVVEEPTKEKPAKEESASVVVEEPSLAPVVEEPVSPVVEEPTKEKPAKEESASVVVEEPASPVVEEPAEEEPADEEPTAPVVEEPAEEEPALVVVEESAQVPVEERAQIVIEEPSTAVSVEEPASVMPFEEPASASVTPALEPAFEMPVGEALVEEPAVVQSAVEELAPVFSVSESVTLEAPVEEPAQAAADTSAPATMNEPVDSSVTAAPSLDTGDALSGEPTEADRNPETDPSAK